MQYLSTFLFADPSLVDGVAHLFDFEGNYNSYNLSRTPEEADANALYIDWLAIGATLTAAMSEYSAKYVGEK